LAALLMRLHYEFDRERFMNPGDDPEVGYAAFLRAQLDEPDAVILVAERHGVLLGYVYAAIEPPSWKDLRERAGYVHDLIVHPEERRGGVATALLEAALQWLRGHDTPRVVLSTSPHNEAAQALFARLGFRRTMIEMTRELRDGGSDRKPRRDSLAR
jgi:ribosomal protein S18 acetylase RimI-like enzyme